LDINLPYKSYKSYKYLEWSHLENLTLPVLKILKVRGVSSKSLVRLIENTNGCLTEISIDYQNDKSLIQSIYRNCPNLRYIKLCLVYNYISELENLLTNCQLLNGLVIDCVADWNALFKILTKSSPIGLFKFKFYFNMCSTPKIEFLKSFFDNWKGRHSMLLQTIPIINNHLMEEYFDLIEKYKAEGIIKKYDNDLGNNFELFEWIQRRHTTII
jgi:hypothetical protein